MDETEAEKLLKSAVGDDTAQFREGQWEAIDGLVNQRRKLLVVQRTGWGKSSVYFITTRILRDRGAGPTIIISPLLALMRNQIEAAERLGLRAATINSANVDDWQKIKGQVLADQVDTLLISPERLSNENFVETILLPIADRIGLLVVDEAHCISDWGHDFRPDYRRLINILQQMPPNMPILGTTATANLRVVEDIQQQLGDIDVLRGTLVRESLSLQTLRLNDQPARLAWLAKHIPEMPGTGIVYVLTKRDAEQVSAWLNLNGISSQSYYSGVSDERYANSDAYRQHLENQLMEDQLKVLVATSALGMGYDKPNLGFVVHYQAPGSIVSYYQQVGRAGRNIDDAWGVLLSGKEDEEIHAFFQRSAFPNEKDVESILRLLEAHDGLSANEIQEHLNLRFGKIEQALKYLRVENPSPVAKDGPKWVRTPVAYQMNHEAIQRLTQLKEVEWEDVQEYIDSQTCLMAYLQHSLDDPNVKDCGKCAVCVGESIIGTNLVHATAIQASQFLKQADIPFRAKIQVAKDAFPSYGFRGNLRQELRASEGRILSRWGDAGWGGVVMEDKHAGQFRDELVDAMAELYLERWGIAPRPTWITCVPSKKRPNLVPDFARRLAGKIGLPFIESIAKIRDNQQQKNQNNRYHQCSNLDGVFALNNVQDGPVLLVDDVIHSGWTITVLAALLRQSGSGPVYPMALATYGSDD